MYAVDMEVNGEAFGELAQGFWFDPAAFALNPGVDQCFVELEAIGKLNLVGFEQVGDEIEEHGADTEVGDFGDNAFGLPTLDGAPEGIAFVEVGVDLGVGERLEVEFLKDVGFALIIRARANAYNACLFGDFLVVGEKLGAAGEDDV